MSQLGINCMRAYVRGRNRFTGLDQYQDPLSYFGPGGVDEAEEQCAAANADFFEFFRPRGLLEPRNITVQPASVLGGFTAQDWSFDSPRPSGDPHNDRVHLRLYRRRGQQHDRVVLFHHPVYQRHYRLWEPFLAPLAEQVPVALMVAPWHFDRGASYSFPGEGMINPNPYRLYQSLRQWCHDHHAAVRLLENKARLKVVAEVGYSLGGFQSLVLASAGEIDRPLVTISATNRYARGLERGVMGHNLKACMHEVGIDFERLRRMTRQIELEKHVHVLRDKPTMYVYGGRDWVDPPPSLDVLREALQPTRTLFFPKLGHAAIAFRARQVHAEVTDFLREVGALDAAAGSSGADSVDRRTGT